MWNSLRRIAAALEVLAQQAGTAGGVEQYMATLLENQKRSLAQTDAHQLQCDEYHKTMIAQINASMDEWRHTIEGLAERMAALEQSVDPWKKSPDD